MILSDLGELSLVEIIRGRFSGQRRGKLLHGIGDDAAVTGLPLGKLLSSTDIMAEGVHFDLSLVMPYQLGFKLVSVNVSDIYAMGGKPLHILLALAMPSSTDMAFLERFFDGVSDALDLYGASLAGGDISACKGDMVLTATVIGQTNRPVLRSGARPGDALYVTGPLGDSASGLELLRRIGGPLELDKRFVRGPLPWKSMEPLIRRHLLPEARKPGAWLGRATAMIDVSDGLALDLSRMCTESGVGAVLDMERIPVSEGTRMTASVLKLNTLDLVLSGGEDYELLFAASGNVRGRPVRIGEIVKGDGVVLRTAGGPEKVIEPKGYKHFDRGVS